MGTGGPGPFDNDAAGDWTWELEHIDLAVLREQLRAVTRLDHVEVSEGCEAVAAAEVVAAAAGAPVDPWPDEVRAWIAAHPEPPDAEDRRLAAAAIRRVRGQDSELAELWGEAEGTAWEDHCDDLLARLGSS